MTSIPFKQKDNDRSATYVRKNRALIMGFIERRYFFLLMVNGILIGGALRFYRISSQIIWDDEWHGINTALLNPVQYIFTHFHWDDNSIPLTIYYRIMLKSFGLNEMLIRLPHLLSGLLILIIFPLIVKRFFNARVAIIFLFMLAIFVPTEEIYSLAFA